MLHLSTTLPNQIRSSLLRLNDAAAASDLDSTSRELCQFIESGSEWSVLVLQTCMDYIRENKAELKYMKVEKLLVSVFKFLLGKPNFGTVFCRSLRSSDISEEFLDSLSSLLQLSLPEKIRIGLGMSDSENADFRALGEKFCLVQIEALFKNPDSTISVEDIQNIVEFLQRLEGFSRHINSLKETLALVQHKDDAFDFALKPLLPDELHEAHFLRNVGIYHESGEDEFDAILTDMEKEMSVGDIVKELGYGCTFDASCCKEIFSLCSPLTEVTIAKIIGAIISNLAGLEETQSTCSSVGLALGWSILPDLPPLSSWDMDILIKTVKQLAPGTDWKKVMENLDHEGFYIPNEEAFFFLLTLYRHACQDPFPLYTVCGSLWRNTEGQLSFLKYAVLAPPEVFTFVHSGRLLTYNDAVHDHKLQVAKENHAWLCLDLLDVLCQLAERGHSGSVQSMLEYPLNHCPEILLLGVSHLNTAYNFIQNEVAFTVFPMLVKSGTGSDMVRYLWHVNSNLVVRGFINIHNTVPDSMTLILSICQELKILSPVLDMIPSPAAIRLAALASRNELVDLEEWLTNNLITYKEFFFEECVKFLKEFGGAQGSSSQPFQLGTAVANAYANSTSTFLKVLKAHSNSIISTQLHEELERLQLSVLESNTSLQNGASADVSTSDGYPIDVESEANSYFHQIFSGPMPVDSIVQMLARFKESSVRREQLIFECMIANVFEEYKFFPKYPERQLKVAAILFGSIIKHHLVTHLTLGIALRGVLDALRKPLDSKMFVFGIKALEQFVDRLIEWPQYCNHILQISHLRTTHPEIVAFIERALARISSGHLDSDVGTEVSHQHGLPVNGELSGVNITVPPQELSSALHLQQRNESPLEDYNRASVPLPNDSKPTLSVGGPSSSGPSGDAPTVLKNSVPAAALPSSSSGFIRPSRGVSATRFGSALNIETLVAAAERRETPIEAPPSEVQDKISFMINNISSANLDAKTKEFTEILKEQYYPWFAQYMVMKRLSIEPNFHDTYLKFLEKVNSKALYKEIVQATYENCKVLLGSDLIKSSAEERSLLKNLGSWLGKLTIGRNQVLRAREIDPKSLIIEAYEKGLMIAVIPFTSKILEPCQSSQAYQPPNPWTMGILGLLAEIYSLPNLKMNLKFDIEVLFKNLGVDMKDITPSSLLKDRKREIEGNPDFSNKEIVVPQPQVISEVKPGPIPPLNHVELPLEAPSPPNSGGHTHMLSQFAPPIHLSPGTLMENEKLAALGMSDQLPSAQGLFQASQSQMPFPLATSVPNTEIIINQKIEALGLGLHFKRALPMVMERAIKEIVSTVIQRSVSIATQTTKELVLKDYAMESDETRIYNAAHLMVASLAGSLAHVTCKEPLRSAISSQLRSSLLALIGGPSDVIEHAILLATNDNLDLGCAIIEHAATEKGIQTVDEEIGQQLSLKRKHRDGHGTTFFDANLYMQGSISIVPEALRPKPGHLSVSQQRVYEDFIRLPWQNQTSQGSQAIPMGSSNSAAVGLSSSYGTVAGQFTMGSSSAPANVISEAIGPNSTAIFSASAIPGSPDSIVQQASESITAGLFPVSAQVPELQSEQSIENLQESGISSQPLPSTAASERFGSSILEPSLSTRDALDKCQIIEQKLETLVQSGAKEAEIQGLIAEFPEIILRCVPRDEAAMAVAQKVFKGLYENASNSLYVNASFAILASIRDVCKRVVKELTQWVIYSEEERKFNKDITLGLIHSELLNLAEYNIQMAKLIDGGKHKAATEFSISLIQSLVVEDSKIISELQNLVDALAKVAAKPGSPETLRQLIEIVRNPVPAASTLSGMVVNNDDKMKLLRDKKSFNQSTPKREDYSVDSAEPDPAGLHDQATTLFAEWCQICELPGSNDAACSQFILQLLQNGLLKGDDITDRFFCILLEVAVAHCLSSEGISSGALHLPQQVQTLSFLAIDIYAKLVFSVLKVEQISSILLPRIMSVTVKFMQKDSEEKKMSFNPRPFFRLFINWLLDLVSLEPVTDGVNFQILTALAGVFHQLQPIKIPAFSYAWLELVSHRSFMPKLLIGNAQKGWPLFQRLLLDLFQFLEPFLRSAELGVPIQVMYKGTLRVLLVLLHDFPEFLCDYHFTFCDLIPPSCIQMRNIVLSAFPRNMRLPDPSTPNLKIDLLPEIREHPHILSDVDAALRSKHLKIDVDDYLKTRQKGSPFLTELKKRLLLSPSEVVVTGTRYNAPLINSLVLYAGMQAIQQLQAKTSHTQSMGAVLHVDAALDIYQALVFELDTEGRYLFLNAIANQLRYPNNHTHYFSFVLLYLFSESNQEIIQEQVTRVLLERLIVSRPHPWGLLITFIELIKNPRYNFWNKSFIRCAPEIEKLFDSVARSCGSIKPIDDSMVSGWVSENAH